MVTLVSQGTPYIGLSINTHRDQGSRFIYYLYITLGREREGLGLSLLGLGLWTEHLQSHFVQPQESAPHLIPGQFNLLPTRHQLLSGQLRSRQILPSDIAVPPGPGGRYRNMNTTFQLNNERAPVYELPPIHTLAIPPLEKTFQT